MSVTKPTSILIAAVAALTIAAPAQAEINVSLNVFPISFADPDGGGEWTMVAKTDNSNGIAAINALLQDVDNGRIVDGDAQDEITVSDDIGAIDPIDPGGANEQPPYTDLGGGVTDLLYGQDIADESSVVFGVGTPSTSDGLDPLGEALWDDATIIAFGTYSSTVPSFNGADGNEFSSITPPIMAAAADVMTTVRVAVPEPTTIALYALGLFAACCHRRR